MNTAPIEDIAVRLAPKREEAARIRKELEPLQARVRALEGQLERLDIIIADDEAKLRAAVHAAHAEDPASEVVDAPSPGEAELQATESRKATVLRHLRAAGEATVDHLVSATGWSRSAVQGPLYRLRDEGLVQNGVRDAEGRGLWRVAQETGAHA